MSLFIGHIQSLLYDLPLSWLHLFTELFYSGATAKCHYTVPCITQTGEIILHCVFAIVSISRLLTDSLWVRHCTNAVLYYWTWLAAAQLISHHSCWLFPPLPSLWFCFHFRNFQQCFKESWSLCWTRWSYPLKKSPFFNGVQRTIFRTCLLSCPAPWDTVLT